MTTHVGHYVTLVEAKGGLWIRATDRTLFAEIVEMRNEKSEVDTLRAMTFDQIERGWECGDLDDLGALSNAPYLARSVERDDRGEIVNVEGLYYFERYAVEDPIATIAKNGQVWWPAAPAEKANA